MVSGAPVFVILAGLGLVLFLTSGGPLAAVPTEMYDIVSSATLPTIPLFTLAGTLLAQGRTPAARLVAVFRAFRRMAAGRHRGGDRPGLRILRVVHRRIGGDHPGARGLLFPVLVEDGFSPRFSIGLLTAAGSIGLLFPPSLPVILYGVTARVPIDQIVPGESASRRGHGPAGVRVLHSRGLAFRQARPAARSACHGARGVAGALGSRSTGGRRRQRVRRVGRTLVEAAALTALYALVMKCVVQREVGLVHEGPRILSEVGDAGGRIIDRARRVVGPHQLSCRCGSACPRGCMGAERHPLARRVPACAERIPARCRLSDGHPCWPPSWWPLCWFR